MNEEIKAKLIGYLSRHVVLSVLVILGLFWMKMTGKVDAAEVSFWYDCVKYCLMFAIGGHALNKYVDGKNQAT